MFAAQFLFAGVGGGAFLEHSHLSATLLKTIYFIISMSYKFATWDHSKFKKNIYICFLSIFLEYKNVCEKTIWVAAWQRSLR